jgi:hypothetical protein
MSALNPAQASRLDQGAFARSWYARNSNTHSPSRMGKQEIQELFGCLAVRRSLALNQ